VSSSRLFAAIPAHRRLSSCVRAYCLSSCVRVWVCMRARARTLLSAVALAGASSSLHSWSIRAVGPALEVHDLTKALTGAHCMGVSDQSRVGSCLHSMMLASRKPHIQCGAGRRFYMAARHTPTCMASMLGESKRPADARLQMRSKALRGTQATLTTASFFLGVA
jgi:hypothetical protein